MTSKLSFSGLPADFLLYPVKNDSVRKKSTIFLNSSCYYIDVRLKLKKLYLRGFQWLPIPNLFNLKKDQSLQS